MSAAASATINDIACGAVRLGSCQFVESECKELSVQYPSPQMDMLDCLACNCIQFKRM